MSAPLADISQPPRRSPRRSKKDLTAITPQMTPIDSEKKSLPTLPAKTSASSSPPSEATNIKGQPSAARRKTSGPKKQTNVSESIRATPHVQSISQSNLLSPNKKATPLKQAYAGPTFHSSPAASSLPMPSFYSKSLPAVTASPSLRSTTQLDGEGQPDSDTETLMPDRSENSTSKSREPSPLDFMFEAARKARESPRTQSPDFRATRLSPFEDIPRKKPRTPDGSSTDLFFPFELDGNGGRPPSIGPFVVTPYKERIEALRSPNAQSPRVHPDLDEKERKEKSEALKRLLINASPLRSAHQPDMNSYFPDRSVQTQSASPFAQRHRQKSGPPAPQSGMQNAPAARNYLPSVPISVQEGESPAQERPVSSHLRREYQPDDCQTDAQFESDSGPSPRISPAVQNTRHSVSDRTIDAGRRKSYYSNNVSTMQTRSSHNAQKLEDDLRRVLKLDLTSSS